MNQPIEPFKVRLKKAMDLQTLKPVELAEKCGISKSTVSHYMSGYTEPKSNRLYIMAKVLNVNEAWLMGFDVPMERNTYEDQNIIAFEAKSDAAQTLLVESGCKISVSDDEIITILDLRNNIICSLHEYELVNIYESLIKQNNLSAQTFIDELSTWWQKIDNSFSGKEAPKEVYDKFFNNIEKHHGKRAEILDIYNQLSPENQQKTLSYSKNLLSIQQMDEELNAACDKCATEEQKTAADNIMMDDGEWE